MDEPSQPSAQRPAYLAPRVYVRLSAVEAARFDAARNETSAAVYCRQAALRLAEGCLTYAAQQGINATRRTLIRLLRTLWYGPQAAVIGPEDEVPRRPTRYERMTARRPPVSFKPHQLERIKLARYGGYERAEGAGVLDLATFVYVATVTASLHDHAHRDDLADLDALESLVVRAGVVHGSVG